MTNPAQFPFVAKTDLGPVFYMQNGKLMVAVGASTDNTNVEATTGSDGKVSVTAANIQSNQITYSLIVDSQNKLVKLAGSDGTSTTVSTETIEAIIDDIAVNGSVVTFADSTNPSGKITVDFSKFLTSLMSANSTSATIYGDGHTVPFTVNLTVDPVSGNLLKIGANGVSVNSSDILSLLNSNITNSLSSNGNTMTSSVNGITSNAKIVNSNSLTNFADTTGNITSSVNGVNANAAAAIITDLSGNIILTGFA